MIDLKKKKKDFECWQMHFNWNNWLDSFNHLHYISKNISAEEHI